MAPKRRAPKEAAARPSKKSLVQIPQVLVEASETLPPAVFIKLISQHVLPGIDDASFKAFFQQAIDTFKAKSELQSRINFDVRKQAINASAKELKRSLKNDWHDGTDYQIDCKGDIAMQAMEWLDNLFKVAIEEGLELATVQKCLVFMEGHIVTMMNDNTRCDYSNCYDCHSDTVKSSQGDSRYDGPPNVVIPLFWRDLLLVAIIQGDKALLSNFKTHRAAAKPKPFDSYPVTLTDLLPLTPGPEHDHDRNKEDLQDDWHTDAMKKAMPQLHDFL